MIEPFTLDIPEERAIHAIRYQTAVVDVFLEIVNTPDILHHEYAFIDLGSGKGRVLLLASRLPFHEIIGVELSHHLHLIACRNIQVYDDPDQRCHRIVSVCCDVTQFEIPKRPLFFYLFNPFDESVLQEVIENIARSWHAALRKMYTAYLKPLHRQVLDQMCLLKVANQTERYVIYESRSETPAWA